MFICGSACPPQTRWAKFRLSPRLKGKTKQQKKREKEEKTTTFTVSSSPRSAGSVGSSERNACARRGTAGFCPWKCARSSRRPWPQAVRGGSGRFAACRRRALGVALKASICFFLFFPKGHLVLVFSPPPRRLQQLQQMEKEKVSEDRNPVGGGVEGRYHIVWWAAIVKKRRNA